MTSTNIYLFNCNKRNFILSLAFWNMITLGMIEASNTDTLSTGDRVYLATCLLCALYFAAKLFNRDSQVAFTNDGVEDYRNELGNIVWRDIVRYKITKYMCSHTVVLELQPESTTLYAQAQRRQLPGALQSVIDKLLHRHCNEVHIDMAGLTGNLAQIDGFLKHHVGQEKPRSAMLPA